ncbi:hypothetical protein L9F63_020670 [Diploptera punctata]|uniref:Lipid-binding serum glycoprotein N-terminal domain-containing protein n=1 Tax=Diploptera punctata TaxID=6984 RepID=A0AAD7ZQS0_DIPPU|nr:hypothetical protein L9F63_020670 [Diploptera punctata]
MRIFATETVSIRQTKKMAGLLKLSFILCIALLQHDVEAIDSFLNKFADKLNQQKNILLFQPITTPFRYLFSTYPKFEVFVSLDSINIKAESINMVPRVESVNGNIHISTQIDLKGVEIVLSASTMFLGNFHSQKTQFTIHQISYNSTEIYGAHTPTCVDVSFENERLFFSDIQIHVEPKSKYFIPGEWLQTALVFLRNDITPFLTAIRDNCVRFVRCTY